MYHFATCLHSSNCGCTDNTYSLQIWRDTFFWIKTREGSLRSGLRSHRLGASTLEAFDQGVHPTGIPEFRSYRKSTSCRQPFMLAPISWPGFAIAWDHSYISFWPTLCDPVDCSPPGSPVHVILQARIPEWVAIFLSRGSSQPKDRTRISCKSPALQADSLLLSHWVSM